MAAFLLDSLAPETRAVMLNAQDEWCIDGMTQGPMLFKAIISKTIVDNHHTTQHLEDRLEALPQFFVAHDSDVPKLHMEYREVTALLTGRGKTDYDGLKYLFRAYALCKDKEFRDYIKRKKEDHDDAYPNSPLTVDKLIQAAQNKYTLRTRESGNVWGSKTPDEERIVAMAAQLEEMALTAQSEKLRGGLQLTDRVAAVANAAGKRIIKNTPKKIKVDPVFDKLKRTPPQDGEPHERTFGPKDHRLFTTNKTYHWCPHHLMWCLHTEAQCKKGKDMERVRSQSKGKPSRRARIRAFQAFMALSDEDPEDYCALFDDSDEQDEDGNDADAASTGDQSEDSNVL